MSAIKEYLDCMPKRERGNGFTQEQKEFLREVTREDYGKQFLINTSANAVWDFLFLFGSKLLKR